MMICANHVSPQNYYVKFKNIDALKREYAGVNTMNVSICQIDIHMYCIVNCITKRTDGGVNIMGMDDDVEYCQILGQSFSV